MAYCFASWVSTMKHSYNFRNTRKGNNISSIQSHGSYTEPHECCRFLHYMQTCDHLNCSLYTYACFEGMNTPIYIIRVIILICFKIIHEIIYKTFINWIFSLTVASWKYTSSFLEWIAGIYTLGHLSMKAQRGHRPWEQLFWGPDFL